MHADIVLCLDSTRKLYEKKLTEAMAKNKKPSSDKTYYREERNSLIVIKRTVLKSHIPILGTCSDLSDSFFVFHRGRNHIRYVSSTSKFESQFLGYSCIDNLVICTSLNSTILSITGATWKLWRCVSSVCIIYTFIYIQFLIHGWG